MGVSMEDLVMDLRNDLRALKATLVGIQDNFRRLELYEKSTTVPRPSVLAPALWMVTRLTGAPFHPPGAAPELS